MSVSYPAKQDGKGIPDVTLLPIKTKIQKQPWRQSPTQENKDSEGGHDVSLLPSKIKMVKAALISVPYPTNQR